MLTNVELLGAIFTSENSFVSHKTDYVLKNNYFDLKENVNVSVTEDTTVPVTKIEDIIYPMYIPENTTLTSQDKVSNTLGDFINLDDYK